MSRNRSSEVATCAGETVSLPCNSDRRMPVDWRHRDSPTSDGSYVVASGFVQKAYQERFRLNRTTKQQYDLVVSNVRLDDQGLYVCIEDAGLGPRHEYQLNVHDGCNSELKGSGSAGEATLNNNKSSALITAAVVVFVVIVVSAIATLIIRRRRIIRQRQIARAAEDITGDVVEELDEMRRSFSARLRSETLQRQSENLEKDSKIHKLETILESQLAREKAKDRKIAELVEKVDAMAESRHQKQTVELELQRRDSLTETDVDLTLKSET